MLLKSVYDKLVLKVGGIEGRFPSRTGFVNKLNNDTDKKMKKKIEEVDKKVPNANN